MEKYLKKYIFNFKVLYMVKMLLQKIDSASSFYFVCF